MLSVCFAQPSNTVKLQGISGYLPGTPAGSLRPGMVTVWNYGYKERVLSVTPSKTGKTVYVDIECIDSGYKSTRKLGANRLVVVDPDA